MRILVLRGGALGDFVVTLPALALLRRRWPGARIELVGNARAAALALDGRHLDAVHSQHEARWARLGSGALRPDEPLARWLAEFDLVVNFWPDTDGAIEADFARLGFIRPGSVAAAGGPVRHIVSASPLPSRRPASAHFCAALAPLDIVPATTDLAPRLVALPAHEATAAAMLPDSGTPWVAWHPGSGSPAKNWPRPRWLEVLEHLRRARPFRLVCTPGEAEAAEASYPPGTRVLRDVDAPLLAALFARCRLFLGHDSGPAHVAAAAGCPCALVFGPTDPRLWAPPHASVVVRRRDADIASVGVADVVSAALEAWDRGRRPG